MQTVRVNGRLQHDTPAVLNNGQNISVSGPFEETPAAPAVDEFDATLTHDGANVGVNGTDGDDVIVSTAASRYIQGRGGDDVVFGSDFGDSIFAGNGNNIIVGGSGNDTLYGGTGDDSIYGEGGSDTIFAGGGNNILYGGSGDDIIYGGNGNDFLSGGGGNNILHGGNGNDTLFGGSGDDILIGGGGDNYIYANAGNNLIFAGDYDDPSGDGESTVMGGNGDDVIFGGAGSDTLYGAGGSNEIYGEDGDDTIYSGTGNNIIDGGTGVNTVNYSLATGNATISLIDGEATRGGFTDTLTNIQNVTGTNFNDEITGNDSDNILRGTAGNNTIYGYGGNNTIYGGSGDDTIYAAGEPPPSGWHDLSWSNRQEITIDAANVNADLTDFTILLTDANFGADFWNNVNADGSDIVITAADGTKLDRELVSINTMTETMELYVKTPLLSSTSDTGLLIYYGNEAATETNSATTWNGNYAGVWHLGSSYADSTANGNNGAATGSLSGTGGQVGDATDFSGTGNYITVANDASLNPTTAITIEYWFNNNTVGGTLWKGGGWDDNGYTMWHFGNNAVRVELQNTATSTKTILDTTVPTGEWVHFAVTWSTNDNTMRSYVNGVEADTATFNSTIGGSGRDLFFGQIDNSGSAGPNADQRWYNGQLDEVKISDVAHSAEWIAAQYQNMNNPGSFYTVGSTEEIYDIIEGDNTIYGGGGNDTIYGSIGSDVLYGEAGNDTIYSGSRISVEISTALSNSPDSILLMDGRVINFFADGSHTFTAPDGVAEVEYLIVGGGGGGGGISNVALVGGAGGGGAGGVLSGTMGVTSGNDYNVTVGGGGAGGVGGSSPGGTGGSSSFDSITANGGGGGASVGNNNGQSGASGGGGRLNGSGGNGSQGNDGGNGSGASVATAAAGGGGGAGSDGANGSGNNGGNGGNGVMSAISGTETYYGGGGGGGGFDGTGGTGGLGGGGSSPNARGAGTDGVDGFGGGGGGAGGSEFGTTPYNGGRGGDGIVIIAYQMDIPNMTVLNGGAGNDELYGSDGMDIFTFGHIGAANLDTVHNFDRQMDKIDIRDLLTGYDPISDAIADFVQITESGGNSNLRVDSSGSGSFGSDTQVASIIDVTGLDSLSNLENLGILITA